MRLWRTATGEQLDSLGGYETPILSLVLTADGGLAAAGNEDGHVRLWNTQTGKERRRLKGHTGAVTSLALAPEGNRLASGSADRTVTLWNGEYRRQKREARSLERRSLARHDLDS